MVVIALLRLSSSFRGTNGHTVLIPRRRRADHEKDCRETAGKNRIVVRTNRVQAGRMTAPPAWLWQRIVEAMPEAVIVSDPAGAIILWNRGAEAMFGHAAADALGQSLDLIIPERFRDRHWDGYRTVMSTGVTRYGRELLAVPAIRKDGSRISIEFSLALLRDEQGAIAAAVAVIRDVTARWERERAARTR
jgi:PAS domain S-box-containing protein